mgnify:CR=1 FL=1
MNRYMIVIPAKNRSFVLKCDEGDGAKLETLQKLVSGYVETVPSALDATWAREEADRLVLLEHWDSQAHLDAHMAGAPFQAIHQVEQAHVAQVDVRLFDVSAGEKG